MLRPSTFEPSFRGFSAGVTAPAPPGTGGTVVVPALAKLPRTLDAHVTNRVTPLLRGIIVGKTDTFHQLITTVVANGFGPLPSSRAYAEAYAGSGFQPGSEKAEKAVRRIIAESTLLAGASGFTSGLGGLATALVAIPASAVGTLLVNARMVGAIAHLRGHDVTDERTIELIKISLAGSAAQGFVAKVGVQLGERLTWAAVRKLPAEILKRVNQDIARLILTRIGGKFGGKALVRGIPLLGGFVGGGIDAFGSAAVARAAQSLFAAQPVSTDASGTESGQESATAPAADTDSSAAADQSGTDPKASTEV
ncbi:hypothetical protein CGZ91_13220 [Parenemella sanctibonifatiensis]|uniref:EcsC family protein n=1 Tax=Parenemella sanctibonifatiensis TaxID=2016505 RepID=A0A255EAH1_9ACTN|nr:hypothetical protein CGZ91_13220 [Parenemella sanctibonifatiensis]